MPVLFAQAADDQFALALCVGAVLLSAGIMFVTPVFTRMTGQIRLHQPEQTPEWSAGSVGELAVQEVRVSEKAA